MKFLVLAVSICMAAAAPQFRGPAQTGTAKAYSSDDTHAEVLRSSSNVEPNGYNFEYETSNGISAQESGTLRKVTDVESISAQGSYQYTSPEGKQVQITYVADENGYQPSGDAIPTPPPTPEYVAKLLKYIEEHPPKEEPVSANKKYF